MDNKTVVFEGRLVNLADEPILEIPDELRLCRAIDDLFKAGNGLSFVDEKLSLEVAAARVKVTRKLAALLATSLTANPGDLP